MAIRRFFSASISGETVELDEEESRHYKTLRIRPSEKVEVLDGRGSIYECISFKGPVLKITGMRTSKKKPYIDLYMPTLKSVAQREAMRHIASFPVRSVCFFRSTFSAVSGRIKENDAKILKEGIKQSGNPFLPSIQGVIEISQIALPAGSTAVFGAMKGSTPTESPMNSGLSVIAGPEGGLTQKEEEILVKKGARPVMLSPYILRSEAAVIALLSIASVYKNHGGE